MIWSDEILQFKFGIWYLRNPFPFDFREGNFLESRNFEFLDFKAVPDGWGSIDRSVDGMIPDWKTFLVRKTIPNFWSNNLNQMHEPRFFKLFWSLSGQRFSNLSGPRSGPAWTVQADRFRSANPWVEQYSFKSYYLIIILFCEILWPNHFLVKTLKIWKSEQLILWLSLKTCQ